MPVSDLGFCKEDKICPVITLVLYYDTREWDGARDLYTMMQLTQTSGDYQILSRYIPNYHINLIDAGRLGDTDRFRTDLHQVFGMLKYREDRIGLQKYINENKIYFSNLDSESYFAVSAFLRSEQLLQKAEKNVLSGKETGLDMCEALEELYADGVETGKRCTAFNLKKMGMTDEDIARAVEENINVIKEWFSQDGKRE